MGCNVDAPVAAAATEMCYDDCSPFHNIVGLIVILIVLIFLCGILNGGLCGGTKGC